MGPEWCQLGVKMEVLKTAEEGRELWDMRVAGGQVIIHEGGGQCDRSGVGVVRQVACFPKSIMQVGRGRFTLVTSVRDLCTKAALISGGARLVWVGANVGEGGADIRR